MHVGDTITPIIIFISSQDTITPGCIYGTITLILFFHVFTGHNNPWLHIEHNNLYFIFHIFTGHNNLWLHIAHNNPILFSCIHKAQKPYFIFMSSQGTITLFYFHVFTRHNDPWLHIGHNNPFFIFMCLQGTITSSCI